MKTPEHLQNFIRCPSCVGVGFFTRIDKTRPGKLVKDECERCQGDGQVREGSV